jgi:phosphomannomutase
MSSLAAGLVERVRAWIEDDPDPRCRAELAALLEAGDEAELAGRFADRLRFGTAGLRGPLRAGPMGMNRAVVGRAAAGLAHFLTTQGLTGPVVIGYDARHGSATFARDTAEIVAGAGLSAQVLPRALPTPVLAFAVRELDASAGVMVTASHNPPRDNGYKVYLGGAGVGRGAQIVPPADADIEAAIAAVDRLADVPRSADWSWLGEDIVTAYLDAVGGVVGPDGPRELRIAYTPLHGVGGAVLSAALQRAGFAAPLVVPEQAEPDPDFPTVAFPNPEEPGTLDLALDLARTAGADLVIANDPDADRCAAACGGRLLTGDELGVLLADQLIRRGIRGRFATTIVSSSQLGALCAAHELPYTETLTGFKWIVRAGEDLVYGYEEALGYAAAPSVVRDKDGISAALLIAELAAALRRQGQTLLDRLDEISAEHGVHVTAQVSLRVEDLSRITRLMRQLRADPPSRLLDQPVSTVDDLAPAADVLRITADGVRVVIRPSGTEPKLKAYLQVVEPVTDSVASAREVAQAKLDRLRAETARLLN